MDAEPQGKILVGVVMGSRNDYAVMRGAVEVLREFGVAHEVIDRQVAEVVIERRPAA